ncbi:hypothetical protein CTM_16877 [Clostridium tetanomorphum DSM 665]|nr:hypothetical protein CTM_16877 [Clostridium tetanomorphum DSM 665]
MSVNFIKKIKLIGYSDYHVVEVKRPSIFKQRKQDSTILWLVRAILFVPQMRPFAEYFKVL